MTLMECSFKL